MLSYAPLPTATRSDAGEWRTPATYLDDFRAVAAAGPSRPAVTAHRQGGTRLVTLTYGELAFLVDRLAAGLRGAGVAPGDAVALQLPNRWEFAALTMACARIGAVLVPMMPILRERAVRDLLTRTGARVCVVPDSYRGFSPAGMLAALRPQVPTLEHVVVLDAGRDLPAGLRSFEADLLCPRWERLHGGSELDALRPAPDALAQIAFSSGTTGEPKGIMHTFATLGLQARAPFDLLGLDADGVVLMASPVTHALGFLYGVLMPLSRGMKVVYQDLWDADAALDLVSSERVTWTMAATPFVVDAVRAQRARPRDVSSLRHVTSGGAPIPAPLVAEVRAELGAQLVAAFGMTENGIVTMTGPDDPDDVVAGSDGVCVPWMAVRVVGPDGAGVEVGEIGRLQVRGAAQTIGYFHRPDLYAAAVTADGWFDTGDLARLRPDGGIRIAGRTKDLIIRCGENIPVVEVESELRRHPLVADVAIVGYPDPRLGERACAVVVPSGTFAPTLAELTGHLAALGMAKAYWPERLEVRSELPRTPSGKVQKFVLRATLSDVGA